MSRVKLTIQEGILSAVRIHEVSPRDGLQNEPEILSTDVKVQLINRLVRAGFKDIEVTSFVRPSWVPQVADAAELLRRLPKDNGVRYWALVPNQRGYERAVECGVDYIATFMSASEGHNKRNVNRTIKESLFALRKILDAAQADCCSVRSYVSTAFGCPIDGEVEPARVVEIALALKEAGSDTIVLGDTIGIANPVQVTSLIQALVEAGLLATEIAVHFHDNRGTALVNAYAALRAGVRHFDGSIGGVGGCPFAPGAAGNLATEDLLSLLHSLGESTSIGVKEAAEASLFMESVLGRTLPGRYYRFVVGQSEHSNRNA